MKHSQNIPDQFKEIVSRETIDKLVLYQELLLKWQKKINLVSPNTIENAWERHFVDSIQVFSLLPTNAQHIVDLGSGAGFPGLVLAAMNIDMQVTLIESDRRKCIFLKEVARTLGLKNVGVLNSRIEVVKDIKADVITARALASLSQLIEWSTPFVKNDTVLIFPKGESHRVEIDAVNLPQTTIVEAFDSITSVEAKIIRLSGFSLE